MRLILGEQDEAENESQPTLLGKGPWRGHADMLTGTAAKQELWHLPPPALLSTASSLPISLWVSSWQKLPRSQAARSLATCRAQRPRVWKGWGGGALCRKEPSNSRRRIVSTPSLTHSFSHSFLKYLLRIKYSAKTPVLEKLKLNKKNQSRLSGGLCDIAVWYGAISTGKVPPPGVKYLEQ